MEFAGLLCLLVMAIFVALGVGFLTYWPMYGAPYVPTQYKEIKDIFRKIKLRKRQVFCDIGCGDGRLTLAAIKITKTRAYGIDINWGLIQWCKLRAYLNNNNLAEFRCQNIFKKDLPKAKVYFLYLWPKFVEKLANRFETQKLNNVIVLSKSFEIIKWRRYLKDNFILNGRRFWVYKI